MGVLNVTPDSFSDGGRYADLDAAVAHGVRDASRTAPTWSTSAASPPGRARTGSTRETEAARVLPVIRELAAAGVPMSIDTTRAAVAAAALAAGAAVVNDVSGGLADPEMARVVADAGCPWVLMHWRGHSRADAASWPRYTDVVAEVRDELRAAGRRGGRRRGRRRTGSSSTRAWASPRRAEHNWRLARPPDRAASRSGFPVLVGASRKSYLGRLLAGAGRHAPADRRAGGGHGRHQRARRRGRRLGRAGARRARPPWTRSRCWRRPPAAPARRSEAVTSRRLTGSR